jgi:chromosomal replication initiation ATPase DnaA
MIAGVIPSPVSIDRIKAAVAAEFEVPLQVMVSDRRTKEEVVARQVAIAIACRLTRRSGTVIGRLFGGRDHSTILHAARRVKMLCARDRDFARRVSRIENELRPPPPPAEPVQLIMFIGPLFDAPASRQPALLELAA